MEPKGPSFSTARTGGGGGIDIPFSMGGAAFAFDDFRNPGGFGFDGTLFAGVVGVGLDAVADVMGVVSAIIAVWGISGGRQEADLELATAFISWIDKPAAAGAVDEAALPVASAAAGCTRGCTCASGCVCKGWTSGGGCRGPGGCNNLIGVCSGPDGDRSGGCSTNGCGCTGGITVSAAAAHCAAAKIARAVRMRLEGASEPPSSSDKGKLEGILPPAKDEANGVSGASPIGCTALCETTCDGMLPATSCITIA